MYPGSVKKCLRRNVLCKATGLYMRNDESWICFNASERCLDQEAAGLILQTCDPPRQLQFVLLSSILSSDTKESPCVFQYAVKLNRFEPSLVALRNKCPGLLRGPTCHQNCSPWIFRTKSWLRTYSSSITSSKTCSMSYRKGVSACRLWGGIGQHPIWLFSRGLSWGTPFKKSQCLSRALGAVTLKNLSKKLS